MDGRWKGRSSFDLTCIPVCLYYPARIRGRKLLVPRYDGYCDARNIFIPKARIVSLVATQRVQRTARCRALRSFLYFSLSRSSRDKGDAVGRSITKRNFRTRLLERFFVRARSEGGRVFNAFSSRHQSAAVRAQREGVVSISDATRLPRN